MTRYDKERIRYNKEKILEHVKWTVKWKEIDDETIEPI
jgi:hypothetical protein